MLSRKKWIVVAIVVVIMLAVLAAGLYTPICSNLYHKC